MMNLESAFPDEHTFKLATTASFARNGVKIGIIAVLLACITLFTSLEYVGTISGAFAIVLGLGSFASTERIIAVLRKQALAAILLGTVAWVLVIFSNIHQ